MNHWSGTGRLTRDVDVKTTQDKKTVARFTLACDRRYRKEGQDNADFISCVAFDKTAEFLEKYTHKGMKLEVDGRIQTGSYEKDGVKHYTTDIFVESVGFAESKKAEEKTEFETDGFINIPVGVAEEMPFA